jgi:RimJ/RimL family protein N-acetyltransferase
VDKPPKSPYNTGCAHDSRLRYCATSSEIMFHELEPSDFTRVSHLFQGHKQYLPVFAVIHGNFPGRIFVDDRDAPHAALVWAVSRWAYVDGNSHNNVFNQSLPSLVQNIVIPDSLQMNMRWFELYTANSPRWMATLETSLKIFEPEQHFETVFTFNEQRYQRLRKPFILPAGWSITRAEFPILPPAACDVSFIDPEFKTRSAFGFQLTHDGHVISVCRSNGFVSGNEFMIDVITVDKRARGQGYATAVGTALLDYCLEHQLIPLWETTHDNTPSRRVAHKLGFVEDESYPVYVIEF